MDFAIALIKQLVIQGRYAFTEKALGEVDRDHLTPELVIESILNAPFVRTKRSTSYHRSDRRERVCIIESFTYSGLLLYTKGVIKKDEEGYRLYLLLSAKRSL